MAVSDICARCGVVRDLHRKGATIVAGNRLIEPCEAFQAPVIDTEKCAKCGATKAAHEVTTSQDGLHHYGAFIGFSDPSPCEKFQEFKGTEIVAEALTKSRVLVVFAYGAGLALACEDGVALDFIRETGSGASIDGFVLDTGGVDYEPQADGVYIGVLSLVDDGPGDWPGSRECAPTLRDVRPATAAEWTAHLSGEWPWEDSQPELPGVAP